MSNKSCRVALMRVGIDLGGTKTEGIVLEGEGRLLVKRRIVTPQGDYHGTLASVVRLVQTLERETGSKTLPVGVATPGCVHPGSRLMKNCNSTWLNGRPLAQDLERALARPVRVANDADCLACSEARDGAACQASTLFAVILGTGVGGGIVSGGRLLSGPNGIAGEWGHNPMPWARPGEDTRRCWCGRYGCTEAWLSGSGLSLDYYASTGQTLEAREIADMADEDNEARQALARYQDRLARALAGVVNLLDPDAIVLGGGLSNIASLYEHVPRLWSEWVFTPGAVRTRLVAALFGDASGARGAARLWPTNKL